MIGDDSGLHEFHSITASACDLVLNSDPLAVLKYKEKGYEAFFYILNLNVSIIQKFASRMHLYYYKPKYSVIFFIFSSIFFTISINLIKFSLQIFDIIFNSKDNFILKNKKETSLRYGENPHQEGSFYGNIEEIIEKIHGKELSYNNLLDIDSAIDLISEKTDSISLSDLA